MLTKQSKMLSQVTLISSLSKAGSEQLQTVIEIKLSSNADYLHGYEEQIEDYAKAEGTDKRILVYVQVGNPKRDETIQKRHQERLDNGSNPPLLFMIDAQKQTSASKD